MELFFSVVIAQQISQRYLRLCKQHTSLSGYEVYSSVVQEDDSLSSSTLHQRATSILLKTTHFPGLLELFDYHGQLQTAGQFALRNVLRQLCNFCNWPLFGLTRTNYRRELVTMSDGGTIALDWSCCCCLNNNNKSNCVCMDQSKPIVILLHGLLGDSQSEYVYHFVPQLIRRGYRPVVMVARGCGGLVLTSASTFAGRIAWDLFETIKHIRISNKSCKLFGIGYSLGAAALLHFLAHTGEFAELESAIAVSPPWNVVNTTYNTSWISKIWLKLLAIPLKMYMLDHLKTLSKLAPDIFNTLDVVGLLLSKSIHEIDTIFYKTFQRIKIVKRNGQVEGVPHKFDDLATYYEDISSIHYVHHITVPTFVISSSDDPICPHMDCPSETNDIHVGDSVVTLKAPFGGHLAFPDGVSISKTWCDELCLNWLDSFNN